MDAARARDLLTTEIADLDERARFAEQTRAESTGDTEEGALGQHPGDHGSEVVGTMDSELLVDTLADQRRLIQEALGRLDDGRRAPGRSPPRGAPPAARRRSPWHTRRSGRRCTVGA